MTRKGSRWSRSTSSRRTNCSRAIKHSNSSCRRDSSPRAGTRNGGKIVSRTASGIPRGRLCFQACLHVGSSLEPPLPISRLSFAVGNGYDVHKLRRVEIDDGERETTEDEAPGSVEVFGHRWGAWRMLLIA